jgi:hypothetical protein
MDYVVQYQDTFEHNVFEKTNNDTQYVPGAILDKIKSSIIPM